MKKNNDIRELARKNGVYLWQIADELDMYDSNFSKMLRKELPSEKKAKIAQIIKKISEDNKKRNR